MATEGQNMKFKRINGWSYKTEDNSYMISNCGPRYWFSAEIDQEFSERMGFECPVERSKVYHSTAKEAKEWVLSYNLKGQI